MVKAQIELLSHNMKKIYEIHMQTKELQETIISYFDCNLVSLKSKT